jgi:hypothetical protein
MASVVTENGFNYGVSMGGGLYEWGAGLCDLMDEG